VLVIPEFLSVGIFHSHSYWLILSLEISAPHKFKYFWMSKIWKGKCPTGAHLIIIFLNKETISIIMQVLIADINIANCTWVCKHSASVKVCQWVEQWDCVSVFFHQSPFRRRFVPCCLWFVRQAWPFGTFVSFCPEISCHVPPILKFIFNYPFDDWM
jgi:hypothetical protein